MDVFISLLTTGKDTDADPLSFGLSTADGRFFYCEFTDFSRDKIDRWHDEHIISEFLGQSGIQELVAALPGSKAMAAPRSYVATGLESFLRRYKSVRFVGVLDKTHISILAAILPDRLRAHASGVADLASILDQYRKAEASKGFIFRIFSMLNHPVVGDLPPYNALKIAWGNKQLYKLICEDLEKKT